MDRWTAEIRNNEKHRGRMALDRAWIVYAGSASSAMHWASGDDVALRSASGPSWNPDKMPWLMKAEPDSRVVKGKDVKVSPVRSPRLRLTRQFSVDDFEAIG